jgi:hypothetical protein
MDTKLYPIIGSERLLNIAFIVKIGKVVHFDEK